MINKTTLLWQKYLRFFFPIYCKFRIHQNFNYQLITGMISTLPPLSKCNQLSEQINCSTWRETTKSVFQAAPSAITNKKDKILLSNKFTIFTVTVKKSSCGQTSNFINQMFLIKLPHSFLNFTISYKLSQK